MIKTFCGNDHNQVRASAFAFVDKLQQAGASLESFDADTFEVGALADAAGGVSLFDGTTVYVIDTPSSRKDFYEDVIDKLSLLGESTNQFVVIESTLLSPEKKKFAKHGDLEEFKAEAGDRFNTFSLTDALARKDKKSLWLLFHEARLAGIAIEEIVGVLWWQLKSMRLAGMTNTATEAGMKDYPYNKAKRALGKFADGELAKLSHSLIKLQHDSRLGKCELDVALEKWMLSL